MSYDRVWYSSYRLKIALYLKAPYSRCFCGQKFSVIIKITVFKWTKWAHLIKYTHSVNLPHVYQRIVTSSLTAFYKIFFFFSSDWRFKLLISYFTQSTNCFNESNSQLRLLFFYILQIVDFIICFSIFYFCNLWIRTLLSNRNNLLVVVENQCFR